MLPLGQIVFISIGLLFFFIIFKPTFSYSQEKPIARLADFSGAILIQSRGSWSVKPSKDLFLYSMDKIVTRVGNATIIFNDGATLNVKNNSNVLIQEREKTKGVFKSIERRILLFLGKLNFKTGKAKIETRFETTKAVIGIRGTAGILSIGADGKTYIYFTEGGAKYILGDFIRGVAKDVKADFADQNPVQRATFVAKAAADQFKRTELKVAAGEMPKVQLVLAKAMAKETSAIEMLTYAKSMLNSPDQSVRNWANQQIANAKEIIKKAKKEEQKAIKDGADPEFKGFTKDNPGFDVPADKNRRDSIS